MRRPGVFQRISSRKSYWLPDVVLGGALAVLAAAMSLLLYGWLDEVILRPSFTDFWFGGDIDRVFANLTSASSNHYRTSVHPLFSLIASTPTIGLIRVTGLSPIHAVLVGMATVAATATALLYSILRIVARRLDAVVYTGMFIMSAGFMFWFSVPETYPWGAVSILAAVLAATVIPFGRWPSAVVITSALSLSFTVTNWMAGLVTAFLSQPWRKAIRLSVYAFALVAFLTPIQYALFPTAGRFLSLNEEHYYVN